MRRTKDDDDDNERRFIPNSTDPVMFAMRMLSSLSIAKRILFYFEKRNKRETHTHTHTYQQNINIGIYRYGEI